MTNMGASDRHWSAALRSGATSTARHKRRVGDRRSFPRYSVVGGERMRPIQIDYSVAARGLKWFYAIVELHSPGNRWLRQTGLAASTNYRDGPQTTPETNRPGRSRGGTA